jgi:hypothetical protein
LQKADEFSESLFFSLLFPPKWCEKAVLNHFNRTKVFVIASDPHQIGGEGRRSPLGSIRVSLLPTRLLKMNKPQIIMPSQSGDRESRNE